MIIVHKAEVVCEGCGNCAMLDTVEQRVKLIPPEGWEHFQARDARPPHDYCPECKEKRQRGELLPLRRKAIGG